VGFDIIIFEKSTLNRIYTVKEDRREKYTMDRRRVLNFPFSLGKQWQDTFTGKVLQGAYAGRWTNQYSESFIVSGWEDVQVLAGKFKTIKLEYSQKIISSGTAYGQGGWARYWYSPDAKYFVKCQYDQYFYPGEKDWELTSFEVKK
jgi:hypothetical protein